jgi:hypothetical protein
VRRRAARLLRALGFAAYFVGTVAAGLELGCRLFFPQALSLDAVSAGLHVPDPRLGWALRPDARAVINWQGEDVDVCTDRVGERVSCLAPARRDCERRVLALGDSFAEALGVPYEETVWHHLEAESGACVQVSAVGGWGPGQYARRARERLGSARFDLVILNLYVGNDFSADAARIPDPSAVRQQELRLLPRSLDAPGVFYWLYAWNQWLESRSHAYVALRNAFKTEIRRRRVPAPLQPSRFEPAIVAAALEPVREIAWLARESGTPVLAVLIPLQVQVLDPMGTELRKAVPELAPNLDMDVATRTILPLLVPIEGIEVIDLLPLLRARAGPEHWGSLDGHFSPAGHRLWFELIRPFVRRHLERPPSAASGG